jgi:hypothetical protein
MTALFADTFYWIAAADFTDSAHRRALALTSQRTDSPLITTDEVLAEFLTFFATAPHRCAAKPFQTPSVFLKTLVSMSFRRAGNRFSPAWLSTRLDPTGILTAPPPTEPQVN